MGDEQVDYISGLSADFGIKVKTTWLNATLFYDCLQQHMKH